MTDEQALRVLLDAGAKLLRFRRKPDPEAPHVEAKNPEGFGDWHRIADGGDGATFDACVGWLTIGMATVERNGEPVTLRLGDGERAGIGVLPASLGKLVVDIDLASKRALKTMAGPERQRRSIAGHDAVVAKLGKPDGVQRSPSGGLHLYYPAIGIPEEVTGNATWAIDDAKVGGDIRGTNGWVGVYDLPKLAKMVQAGHGPALDVAKLQAFANNPHREAGMHAYKHVRAGGGSSVQAACAAIRSAEAGDTYAGRNPTIVYHVATLAKDKLLDDAAARAVLDAVSDVKPEAVEDTERFIGKCLRWAEPSTGNTGGPASVRNVQPGGGRGEIPSGGEPGSADGEDGDEAPADGVSGDLATWQGWKDAAGKFEPSSPGALKREAPAFLARIVRRFQGGDAGEARDAGGVLDALQAAYHEGGEEAVKAVLTERGLLKPPAKPRAAVPVPDVVGGFPGALLRLPGTGDRSAVLSLGTVGVLAGAGGMGKSALTASLALSLAHQGEGDGGPLVGGLFEAPTGGGPVLLATWEDDAAMTRWRIEAAAAKLLPGEKDKDREAREAALSRVFLMDMVGVPLFGPRAGEGEQGERPGLYNARPEPLPGWDDLWREVERTEARLVVIDPVLAAFVADGNKAEAVREFLSALMVAAKAAKVAVLLVAHSTKAARKQGQQDDPFDPGNVGGSAAWVDGARSALVLGWDDARGDGELQLAVAKSNYGPSRQVLPLDRVRQGNVPVAFKAAGTWAKHDAGDVGRALDVAKAAIKMLMKKGAAKQVGTLKAMLSKGRNRGGNGDEDWNDEDL